MNNTAVGTFIDSCILLDLFTNDPNWKQWSLDKLREAGNQGPIIINKIVYAEVSLGFSRIEELDTVIQEIGIDLQEIPRSAAFLAGRAFRAYRKRGGRKTTTLPDFFIGAHAAVLGIPLITRDPKRVAYAYPSLTVIHP